MKANSSAEEQAKAALNLIERIVKTRGKLFSVIVDPKRGAEGKDTFTVNTFCFLFKKKKEKFQYNPF